ncbi:CAP domain-containing protein [Aquimarina sp. 2201CG1-2-11]|uniref:CAP domain-containing protein n=1 Tax=Aquimarina discodermiae TaxID=3231043 RepID=UPI0034630F06
MKKLMLFLLLCATFLNAHSAVRLFKDNPSITQEKTNNDANLSGIACSEVEVIVIFDNWPIDISWRIENQSGKVILSGKDYKHGSANVSEKICLEDGAYNFVIDDSFGDGLCCKYGEGKYELNLNGTTLVSGATFTSKETKSFTIGRISPLPTPINLKPSNITSNSVVLSWGIDGALVNTTMFEIYNDDQIIDNVKGAKTITLTRLKPETTYNFSVRAKNSNGEASAFSNKINVTTLKNTVGDFPQEMLDLLALVNIARANNGKQPLKMNAKLVAAALFHANDMNDNNFFSHTGSNGSSVGERITDQGYSWNSYGENIANGYSSVNQVHNGWMNSSGHKKNILSANFTEIGMARVKNYWVQVFGRSFNAPFSAKSGENKITIYPTVLSNDQRDVFIKGYGKRANYKIFNISGRLMGQGEIINNKVSVPQLSAGIYLINIVKEAEIVVKRLFVK